ncbi:MAG: TlpA disulfide reductase family protein [Pseudomonadales bacterium]
MNRLLVIAFTLCLAGAPAAAAAPGEIDVGETLPDAMLRGLNGPAGTLHDFRGRPLIINVWASWCGPCRAEMASLERLAARGGSGVFNVIGISTDDYPERAMAFLSASNSTIRHFIDYRLQLENLLGASRIPLTVLVDGNGRVLGKVHGARDWDSPQAIAYLAAAFGYDERADAPRP